MRSYLIGLALLASAAAPAAAQGRWKEIGKTSANNAVYIDPRSVKTSKGITSARLQVRFTPPVKTPNGTWRASQHLAMFNCAKKTVAAKWSNYYSDLAGHHIVQADTVKIPGFGPAIGGTMTQIALDDVCKDRK